MALLLACLLQHGLAMTLKFRYEECLTYTFNMYEPFYGSFVSMPDSYGMQTKYDLVITAPSQTKAHENIGQAEAKFHLVPYETVRGTAGLHLHLNIPTVV